MFMAYPWPTPCPLRLSEMQPATQDAARIIEMQPELCPQANRSSSPRRLLFLCSAAAPRRPSRRRSLGGLGVGGLTGGGVSRLRGALPSSTFKPNLEHLLVALGQLRLRLQVSAVIRMYGPVAPSRWMLLLVACLDDRRTAGGQPAWKTGTFQNLARWNSSSSGAVCVLHAARRPSRPAHAISSGETSARRFGRLRRTGMETLRRGAMRVTGKSRLGHK